MKLANGLGIGSAICGALSVVAALVAGGAAGTLFATGCLLLAFGGAMQGRREGRIPTTALLGMALGAVGLVLGLVVR